MNYYKIDQNNKNNSIGEYSYIYKDDGEEVYLVAILENLYRENEHILSVKESGGKIEKVTADWLRNTKFNDGTKITEEEVFALII